MTELRTLINLVEAAQAGTLGEAVNSRSPEFRQWFGASQVVDAAGRPLKVYRGSDFDGLPPHGPFFFSTDREFAATYGSRITAAYLRSTKLYDPEAMTRAELQVIRQAIASGEIWPLHGVGDIEQFTHQRLDSVTGYDGGVEWDWIESTPFQNWLKRNGYDGFVVTERADTDDDWDEESKNFAVYSPDQIMVVIP